MQEQRHGSPSFYKLLERMAEIHSKKSHDYAGEGDPFGNYHFAGSLSKLFDNPDDSGFIGRIGEKVYRLANIENSGKAVRNESIEDTEIDICVITLMWMTDRKIRRELIERTAAESKLNSFPKLFEEKIQNLSENKGLKIKSTNCSVNEHHRCSGIFKSINTANSDEHSVCECSCHNQVKSLK